MRGFLNSAVATLFVLALLLVVPIVAVVGIPEFVPVVASSSQALEGTENRVLVDEGVGESAVHQPHDLFAGFDQEPPPARLASAFDVSRLPERTRNAATRTPRSSRSLGNWDVDDRGRVVRAGAGTSQPTSAFARNRFAANETSLGESVPIDGSSGRTSPPHAPTPDRRQNVESSKPLTWKSAVARLNELGIREYSLDPGRDGRDFHFACNFAVDGNLRHGRRFEAEAEEPLLAVERVLDEIDDWLVNRR